MNELTNIEAEQKILGIILNDNEQYFKIIHAQPTWFSDITHQEIFKILIEYCNRGELANFITLKHRFDANYLKQLSVLGIGTVNIAGYVNIVKDLYERTKTIEILRRKLEDVQAATLPAHEIIEALNGELCDIQSNASQYRMVSYKQVLVELKDDIQKGNQYTPTGLERIDRTMNGGMERGKSYCFSAKPKAGKTMLKGTIANSLRKRNVPFLFVAAEMGRREIVKRFIAAETETNINNFANEQKVSDYLIQYKNPKENLFFVDAPRITIEALKSVVNNAVKTRQVEGFVLDYLQLVTGKDSKETIAQHQENVAQTIAELCKKLNIWCLYSCQINRDGEVRNGDGILMAIDWLYEIRKIGEEEGQDMYLKHIATRSFAPMDIGSEMYPSYRISPNGACFYEYQKK